MPDTEAAPRPKTHIIFPDLPLEILTGPRGDSILAYRLSYLFSPRRPEDADFLRDEPYWKTVKAIIAKWTTRFAPPLYVVETRNGHAEKGHKVYRWYGKYTHNDPDKIPGVEIGTLFEQDPYKQWRIEPSEVSPCTR